MLRSLSIALTASLLPSMVFSATQETLRIQIGKDKEILDTATLVIEYDKPPEIGHPNGASWEELETDSLWEEGGERHVSYSHAFRATLGSRKGYGFDYIHYASRGDQLPEYSAGVSFNFPGDTLLQMGWEPLHMYRFGGIYPYDETGFVSGSEVYGQVSKYTGEAGENLAQGQWALLLTRKKQMPILEQEPIAYGKETLHIQIGKDKDILDTVLIRIEYEKFPEINLSSGASWSSLEKDSAWTDEDGWYARYNHAFLVSMGARKGYGNDYMQVSVFSERFNDEPQYSAGVGITLPGDTILAFSWEPNHIVEKAEAYPFHTSGFKSGMEQYGEVSKHTGNGNENLAQGQWAKLLKREAGWTEEGDEGTTAARPTKRRGKAMGWVVHMAPGTVLKAPPGARGLKVLDVQGRVFWERVQLQEGEQVTLPRELNKGVYRFYWQSEQG